MRYLRHSRDFFANSMVPATALGPVGVQALVVLGAPVQPPDRLW